MATKYSHDVVIIGGGFGGLYGARSLRDAQVNVTLIDKRNFHLFQPLLYQVATGGLSPGDIVSPLRAVLSSQKNAKVIMGEVVDIDPEQRKVILRDGVVPYDSLIVATGVSHHYFGNEQWAELAPGLKTIENALDIRRRILLAFEAAERESDPVKREGWMRFVVVGGGPTGVELAGALAELAHTTLKNDFRNISAPDVEVLLLEGLDRILPPYPPELSANAEKELTKLGVTVRTNTMVTGIEDELITVKRNGTTEQFKSCTVMWAAGMKASAMGTVLADRTGVELDRAGRVMVEPNLTVAGYPNIFVIGDLAHFAHQGDSPLPGLAPVAMQEGKYVADQIKRQLKGESSSSAFHYYDKGSMAIIGRNKAVVSAGGIKLTGYFAWVAWVFLHIWFLIGFDNKLMVMFQWAWQYLTRKRGARLITGPDPFPLQGREKPFESVSVDTGDMSIIDAASSASKVSSNGNQEPVRTS